LATEFDCVEDVLRSHMYKDPICENIIRMNDSLFFEHETKLAEGNWLLIIYRCDSKNGLAVDRIFDRDEFENVTEKFKNHPNVVGVMQLINEETRICER
jgi:NhaP-type Na+/H+ and K+/H+ antiporter